MYYFYLFIHFISFHSCLFFFLAQILYLNLYVDNISCFLSGGIRQSVLRLLSLQSCKRDDGHYVNVPVLFPTSHISLRQSHMTHNSVTSVTLKPPTAEPRVLRRVWLKVT